MLDRRQTLAALTATGLGTPLFHRAVVGVLQESGQSGDSPPLTADMIKTAEWISGTRFNDEERAAVAESVNRSASRITELRAQPLEAGDLPATHFQPLASPPTGRVALHRAAVLSNPSTGRLRPATDDDIAFQPVTVLSELIRTRQISSRELTQIYLDRLAKYNPLLNCVVTITDDLALKQAARADDEIAAGKYRGPLHGIPWGAKDLIAVPGYPTTWGIPQFEHRVIDQPATVFERLDEAGAVLVAKLALGAIAMGDKWFRGLTRCPWNPEVGSSGSSAGSASATAAGLVAFSLGSETLGSIVSPCRRCGATGLRPRLVESSRAGCMPLSWSMDKIGPITRCVEDGALVFAAIHGADGRDPTVADRPFRWPLQLDFSGLRIGYVKRPRAEKPEPPAGQPESADQTPGEPARENLETLERLGCQLVEIELPAEKNQWVLADIIDIEAASVFDEMLRARQTEGWNTWPGSFRAAQFVPAIDYLRMMRRRRQLQFKMESLMERVDFLANCDDLLITNLTGHPSVVMPRGWRESKGEKVPGSAILTGRLHDDDRLLALAMAWQNELTAHRERPPLDQFLIEMHQRDEAGSDEKHPPMPGNDGK